MRSHTTIVLSKSTSEHVTVSVTRIGNRVLISDVLGGQYGSIDVEDPAITREVIARLVEACSDVEREQKDNRAKKRCAQRSAAPDGEHARPMSCEGVASDG